MNKSYRLKLFESFRSNFRMSALVTFTKRNRGDNGNGESNLLYASKGYVTMNPGAFLELTYLADDKQINNKSVYLSYQHMARFVNMFDTIVGNAYDPNGDLWVQAGNTRQVNPKYTTPLAIDNIGFKNSYVRLSLYTRVDDNGMVSSKPGVRIELSGGAGSNLTLEEAETIGEILHETYLPSLAMSASTCEVMLRAMEGSLYEGQNNQQQTQYQQTYQPQPQQYRQAPTYQQPAAQTYQNQYTRPQPVAQTPTYQPRPQANNYQHVAAPTYQAPVQTIVSAPAPAAQIPPSAAVAVTMPAPNAEATNANGSAKPTPAPREDTGMPLVNEAAVKASAEDINLSDLNVGSDADINYIFDEGNPDNK
jgi:hypothetical protein